MSVMERMQALGDHAKSSRQPPLRERKSAKADESAAKQDGSTRLIWRTAPRTTVRLQNSSKT